MTADNILQTIMQRLKDNSDFNNGSVTVASYIPPHYAPPFIEVKVMSYNQLVGQKTATAQVHIKIVSNYCGDHELQKIRATVIKQLTQHPFKNSAMDQVFQGRMMQNDRKFDHQSRTQSEYLTLAFFIVALN